MRNERAPLITLLTDFGTSDGYVAAMKGVISSRAPGVPIVDISHDVPPQDVERGGAVWARAWPWFPPGSVHVCVIDPGVGTARAIIAAEARGAVFVVPDNGVLAYALEKRDVRRVHRVEHPTLRLEPVSRTFHGRDIFAPAAAAIAMGLPLREVGPEARVADLVWPRPPRPRRRVKGDAVEWHGEVIDIDHFGNATTNLDADKVLVGSDPRAALELEIGGHTLAGLQGSYGEVAAGEALVLVGSTGRIEIAVSGGSAAKELGIKRGDRAVVRVRKG